jgi:hypothetical protein
MLKYRNAKENEKLRWTILEMPKWEAAAGYRPR